MIYNGHLTTFYVENATSIELYAKDYD